MGKVKAVIIDDEPGNIVTLSELLKEYCPEISIEDKAANIITAEQAIYKHNPDLIFLDIEMPYGNAFDLLDKLSPVSFEVIFITAFNNYAIKAFKYAALDYILKPVNIGELKMAVTRALKRIKEKDVSNRIDFLLKNLRTENQALQKIGLGTVDGFSFEEVNNIIHLEAEGSYTRVFLKGKKPEMVSKSLKEFEDILPQSNFCRIHHSHIINLQFVKKYYNGRGGYVELENGTKVEVAARKKESFFEKFKR
jgi:two-component system, LytTR family, response regulator